MRRGGGGCSDPPGTAWTPPHPTPRTPGPSCIWLSAHSLPAGGAAPQQRHLRGSHLSGLKLHEFIQQCEGEGLEGEGLVGEGPVVLM